MFEKKSKSKEMLNGVNISFFDTGKNICISTQKSSNNISNRINDFLDAFLSGVASANSNNSSSTYYVHGMLLRAYHKDDYDDIQNERSKVFSPALNKFYLPVSDKFFTNSDYATVKLFVTFDEKTKEGTILHFEVTY